MKELEKLRSEVDWQVYYFSDELKSLGSLEALEFNSARTDIARALTDAGGKDGDAVLLVSDGRHNGPEELDDFLSPLPIWAVSVGEKNLADIGIEDAFFEQVDSNKLRIRLRSSGLSTKEVKLHIRTDGTSEISKDVKLAADQLTEIAVSLPQSRERKVLRFDLDTLPNEDRTDNNSFTLINPYKQGKTRVLFVAGRISEETAVILETLKSLEDVVLAERIEISPGRVIATGSNSKPDVIVVGPVRGDLSSSSIETVKSAVLRGTPVMFIDAARDLPQELAAFFPLEPGSQDGAEDLRSTPLADLLLSRWEEGKSQLNQTSQPTYRPKPGASVLLSVMGSPLITKTTKPIHALSMELPNIAQSARNNKDGFAHFLKASILYLQGGEAFPFRLTVEQSDETALKLELSSAIETGKSDVQAWLWPDSHPLSVLPVSSKSFRATGAAPQGKYLLNLSWKGQHLTLEDTVTVTPAIPEAPSRGVNEAVLQAITRNNSGHLVASEEIGNLVGLLPKRRFLDFKPLNTPWLVIVIGVLMLAEIWYRRRNGLP